MPQWVLKSRLRFRPMKRAFYQAPWFKPDYTGQKWSKLLKAHGVVSWGYKYWGYKLKIPYA
jgi:hypothetical protein